MAKRRIKRLLTTTPFKVGERLTIPLHHSRRVLSEAVIVIEGDMDLSVSGATAKPGGVFNLLKQLELVCSGYEPAINDRVQNEVRINLGGRYLGLTQGITATPNLQPRWNVLNPFEIMRPNSGKFKDVSATNLGKQHFFFCAKVPFELGNGLNPADCRLDTANMQFVDLRLTLGDLQDVFTSANVAGEITEASVSVYVSELEQATPLDYSPNADLPQAYIRTFAENIVVSGDNTDLVLQANLNANLLQAVFATYDEDGDLNDGDDNSDDYRNWYLRHIRVKRDREVYYDLETRRVRDENMDTFALLAGNSDAKPFLQDSGIYIAAPAYEPHDRRTHLSRAPYMGTGDTSAQFVMDVKKPSGGNGTIVVIKSEAVMSAALSAASRRWGDMNEGMRGLATPARNDANEIAMRIQQRARETGVNIVS